MSNLKRDTVTVPYQNFALMSVVSENSNQKSERCALKIRGVFNTIKEANEHAELLHKSDQSYDIFVVEMYNWLLLPPDLTKIKDQKFVDERLNNIIVAHNESKEQAQQLFEERKNELKSGKTTEEV